MRQGERSSRRCTNVNSGRLGTTSKHRGITRIHIGITRLHRGITRLHRGITIIHSRAARRRRRRIVDPIHAALEKGLGDKVYGRILIEKVPSLTEGLIREEHCEFRSGRGCVDQVFVIKQMSEKFVDKNKSLYVSYMDLGRHMTGLIDRQCGMFWVCIE